jgi:AcrR family transcriptional regulator
MLEFFDAGVNDGGVARPRNQTQRRSLLVDSALDAIRERGVGALRIRDVAEAAGVATGTVHYYFDDLDRLLHEVHTRACDRFFDERMAALPGLDDARAKLASMIRSGLPTSQDDAIVIALYEIDLYKRGDPVHEVLGRALFDRQVALYYGIIELGQSQGHFKPSAPAVDVAQNLVGLEDAYGMHIILGNRALPLRRCIELITSYAGTATGCDTIPMLAAVSKPASRDV